MQSYIRIFLSPSHSYVWNLKTVRWTLLKLSCQNQSVNKVQLWTWPFDPKMYRCLSPSCIYVWNIIVVRWKFIMLLCQNQSVDEVFLWPWPLNFWPKNVKVSSSHSDLSPSCIYPKCIGYFLSLSCIYLWNMKAVRWKLLKLSWQKQSVNRQIDGQTWFL